MQSSPKIPVRQKLGALAVIVALLFAGGIVPEPVHAQTSPTFSGPFALSTGARHQAGRGVKYVSPSGNHYLLFEGEGKLVVRDKNDRQVWALSQVTPQYRQVTRVHLNPSNLIAYDKDNRVIWSAYPTSQPSPGGQLVLTSDGTLQLVSRDKGVLWSSDGDLNPKPDSMAVWPERIRGSVARTEPTRGPLVESATAGQRPASTDQPAQRGTAQRNFATATGLPVMEGSVLQRGMKYPSPSGRHYLVFQDDGNLVVYDANNRYVWGIDRVARRMSEAAVTVLEGGNLRVLDSKLDTIWAAIEGPSEPGSRLELNPDGALQLVSPTRGPVWSSDGQRAPAPAQQANANASRQAPAMQTAPAQRQVPQQQAQTGTRHPASAAVSGASGERVQPSAVVASRFPIPDGALLERGKRYPSPSGHHYLVFQDDGNLVVYDASNRYVWGIERFTKRFGEAKSVALEQGNLRVSDANLNTIWSAVEGQAQPGSRLELSPEGALQLVSPSGGAVWSSDGKLAKNSSPPAPAPQAASPAAAPSANGLSEQAVALLAIHNRLRAKHGVPPLTWSADIAVTAERWANACTRRHETEFLHPNKLGENMGFDGKIDTSAESLSNAIQRMYDEIKSYRYERPGFNKQGSSQETQTGHFTQIVWKETKELGCGWAICPNSQYKTILVCRYSPPGNASDLGKNGEAAAFTRNVPRPTQ